MSPVTRQSQSVDETLAIGRALGVAAQGNDVIALCGPLGAGKTILTKGIAAGLGFARRELVTSPTFAIVNEYAARLRLFHVDAYRLVDPRELAALGFEEMCGCGGLVVIEWADGVQSLLPADHLTIQIRIVDPNQRELRAQCVGGSEALLEAFECYGREAPRRP